MSELEENFEVIYLFIRCTMIVLGIYVTAALVIVISKIWPAKQTVEEHRSQPTHTVSTLP